MALPPLGDKGVHLSRFMGDLLIKLIQVLQEARDAGDLQDPSHGVRPPFKHAEVPAPGRSANEGRRDESWCEARGVRAWHPDGSARFGAPFRARAPGCLRSPTRHTRPGPARLPSAPAADPPRWGW